MAQSKAGPVLFVTIPDHGHAGPLMGAARAMLDMGHDVHFATMEAARAKVEAALSTSGAQRGTFCSLGDDPRGDEWLSRNLEGVFDPETTCAEGARLSAEFFMGYEEFMTQRLLQLLEAPGTPRPVCIITDILTWAGHDVAEKLDIPLVVAANLPLNFDLASSGYWAYNAPWQVPMEAPGLAIMPERMTLFQKYVLNPLLKMLPDPFPKAWGIPRNEVRSRLGLPPLPAGAGVCAAPRSVPHTYLAGVTFELEIERPLPPNWTLTGPMGTDFSAAAGYPPPLADGDVSSFLAAAKRDEAPVVYVAFGTVVRLRQQQVATLVAAFEQLLPSCRIVWSLKEAAHAFLPPSLLEDPRILVSSWVQQPAVLAHAAVFITHGGQNSVNEGCAAGKPMLVMPFGGDQPINAQHVVNKGLGLQLTLLPQLQPQVLVSTVLRLVKEPAFKERAAAAGAKIQQASGPVAAARAITAFIQGL